MSLLSWSEGIVKSAEEAAGLRRAKAATSFTPSTPVPLAPVMVTPPPIQPSVVANVQPAPIAPPDTDLSIPPPNTSTTSAPVTVEDQTQAPETIDMSILSDLLNKKTTFAQAATEIEGWGESLIKANPAAEADVQAVVSTLKQGASNAVSYADTELAQYLAPATMTVEVTVDGLLATLTKGASTVANPLINSGIEQAAAALKAVIDAAAVKAKASIASAPAA